MAYTAAMQATTGLPEDKRETVVAPSVRLSVTRLRQIRKAEDDSVVGRTIKPAKPPQAASPAPGPTRPLVKVPAKRLRRCLRST